MVPPPVVTAPRYPGFVVPDVPVELAATASAHFHDRAWKFLQAGDLRMAERDATAALKLQADFYPAEAATGYIALARDDARLALERFDRTLALRPDYLSALVGRGEALLSLDRQGDAIAAFESALVVNPGLTDLRRRVEILRFQALEGNLAEARAAARAGRHDDAIRLFQSAISASPDSPFLYRELAMVEAQRGDREAALEHYRRAVTLDPSDAASLTAIAGLLESGGELEAALEAFDQALAVQPDEELSQRRAAVAERIELARLPAEYQAIESAARVTRADLAALIGVRLGGALDPGTRDGVVITDVRGSWAEPWIMIVARAGVIDAFDNHTFQPEDVVDRADLAAAVARLIDQLAPGRRVGGEVRFSDVAPGHLAYPAAAAAVSSGVMSAVDGAFLPSRPVTGAEASQAIERLRAMTSLSRR
jgi:tetratricopeptide (TPR) repeat protein